MGAWPFSFQERNILKAHAYEQLFGHFKEIYDDYEQLQVNP
jgi:hypothetical protein